MKKTNSNAPGNVSRGNLDPLFQQETVFSVDLLYYILSVCFGWLLWLPTHWNGRESEWRVVFFCPEKYRCEGQLKIKDDFLTLSFLVLCEVLMPMSRKKEQIHLHSSVLYDLCAEFTVVFRWALLLWECGQIRVLNSQGLCVKSRGGLQTDQEHVPNKLHMNIQHASCS